MPNKGKFGSSPDALQTARADVPAAWSGSPDPVSAPSQGRLGPGGTSSRGEERQSGVPQGLPELTLPKGGVPLSGELDRRSFSLRLLEPAALVELLRTGRAQFEIPQWLLGTEFKDGMKLYAMRIKSIALSLPCVTGPHTPANVKVRLLKSWVGWAPGDNAPPLEALPDPDMASEIVTSTAVNDPALFEPSLRDERYLPVKNAGAVSRWEVSLPITPEFDYQTISDLVLHMRLVAKGQVGTSVPATPPTKPNLRRTAVVARQENRGLGGRKNRLRILPLSHLPGGRVTLGWLTPSGRW